MFHICKPDKFFNVKSNKLEWTGRLMYRRIKDYKCVQNSTLYIVQSVLKVVKKGTKE